MERSVYGLLIMDDVHSKNFRIKIFKNPFATLRETFFFSADEDVGVP